MEKKDIILDAMFRLFAEKGEQASMSDLSKVIGIKPQSIYSHFKSKQEILQRVISLEFEENEQVFIGVIKNYEHEPVEERLYSLAFSLYEYFMDPLKLKFWRNLWIIEDPKLREATIQKMKQMEGMKRSIVEEIFQRGMRQSEIKKGNLEGKMALYVAMIQGFQEGFIAYGSRREEVLHHAKSAWDAYWEGIRI